MSQLLDWLNANDFVAFLLRAAVAVTAILLLGLLFALALRRRPAVRAAALSATLLGVVLAPVAAYFASTGSLTVVQLTLPPRPSPPIADGHRAMDEAPIADARQRPTTASQSTATMSAAGSHDAARSNEGAMVRSTNAEVIGAPTFDWRRLVLVVWLSGVAIGCARLVVGHLRLRRIVARSRPIGAESIQLPLAEACRLSGSDRPPRILVTDESATPFVHGLFTPTIYWPASLLTGIPRERRLEVLLHEWAHVTRRDPITGFIQRLAVALYWPHPLIHWLDHALSVAREEACDNWVLGATTPTTYARTLVDLGGSTPDDAPAAVLGLFPRRWRLEDRVRGLLDRRRSCARSARRAPTALLGAVVVAALLLATGTAFVTARIGTTRSIEPPLVLTGRIADEQGAPIASARIQATFYSRRGHIPCARTKSDAEGRYSLEIDTSVAESRFFRDEILEQTSLLIAAEGFTAAFVSGRLIDDPEHVDFALGREDVVLHGRIVDTEGMPRPNCRVRVLSLNAPVVLNAGYLNDGDAEVTLEGNDELLGGPFMTDADGRFSIAGLGRDRRVSLAVDARFVERHPFYVTLSTASSLPAKIGAYRLLDEVTTGDYGTNFEHYGSTFTHVVPKSRPIAGKVIDAVTKEPIAGAHVAISVGPSNGDSIVGITDAEGRYEIHGLASEASYALLRVLPPIGSHWLERSGDFYEATSADIDGLVIPLHRGVKIGGRVVERGTDRGVAAHVEFCAMPDNVAAKWIGIESSDQSVGTPMRFATDPDGRFEFLGLPGRSCLVATARNDIYGTEDPARFDDWLDEYGHLMTQQMRIDIRRSHSVALFEVADDAESAEVRLDVRTGARMPVTLNDEPGNRLDGVLVAGRAPLTYGFETTESDTFTVVGLKKGEYRQIILRDPARRLGRWTTISHPTTNRSSTDVTLLPCGTIMGRIVKPDGAPARFLDLYVLIERIGANGAIDLLLQEIVRTDAGGWFTFDAVPEVTYNILDYRTIVRSGETVDIGSVTLLDRMRR